MKTSVSGFYECSNITSGDISSNIDFDDIDWDEVYWDDGTWTKSEPIGCFHVWKKYVGITEIYMYCTKCDEKKESE